VSRSVPTVSKRYIAAEHTTNERREHSHGNREREREPERDSESETQLEAENQGHGRTADYAFWRQSVVSAQPFWQPQPEQPGVRLQHLCTHNTTHNPQRHGGVEETSPGPGLPTFPPQAAQPAQQSESAFQGSRLGRRRRRGESRDVEGHRTPESLRLARSVPVTAAPLADCKYH
jgi:hypothetical protein